MPSADFKRRLGRTAHARPRWAVRTLRPFGAPVLLSRTPCVVQFARNLSGRRSSVELVEMDCLKLNIRSSFTQSIATELERLFVDSTPDTASVWAEFSTNGQEHDLDEIDELGIRVRQGLCCKRPPVSTAYDPDCSPPTSGGSSPTTTIPMSRARLLEILRMSERGRLKPKAAAARVKPSSFVETAGQVCTRRSLP